jgi:hypothetical protein
MDVQAFFRQLCVNNFIASPYFDIAVLATIKPELFVNHVLELDPTAAASVFSMFQGRYDGGELAARLKGERPWLIEVKKCFEARMASLRPMSRYRLKNQIGHSIDRVLALSSAPPGVVA